MNSYWRRVTHELVVQRSLGGNNWYWHDTREVESEIASSWLDRIPMSWGIERISHSSRSWLNNLNRNVYSAGKRWTPSWSSEASMR
jgi:hypothetical protein